MPIESLPSEFGLSAGTQTKMHAVFAHFPQIEAVKLYGSRAKGTYKLGSDIDLAVVSHSMSLAQLFSLENELDDLLLPYKIDISLLDQIDNPELLEHIQRVGRDFYRRA